MNSRNGASKDQSRGQDSSDEESAVISNIRVLSRLPGRPVGRFRPSAASMPGTSGSQTPAPSSTASPARRPQRDRDRLFWTLMGSSSRLANSRSRASGSSQARAARQSTFADLLEPDRTFSPLASRRYPSFAFNSSYSQQTASLRDMFRELPQGRVESGSTRTGAGSSSGRQVILLRATDNEPAAEASDGTNTAATQVSDEDMEVQVASPQAVDATDDDYVETVIEVEEPINMSAGAMSLEEDVVQVDPEPAPAAAAPGAEEPPADPPTIDNEETPNEASEEPDQQGRGRKRKRDVTGDTHESVATLNHSLLRLLECPVCMEWMEPPIAQCRRGHLVCGACRARLDACPVCRTSFSSVRNRAMEDVAAILRYPCRHGCGREVRPGRRARHEASCASRRYSCPLPACSATPPMPLAVLPLHCQSRHPEHFRSGSRQRVSLRVNCEQHQHWCVAALGQLFHARVDVDVRTWGVVVYVAFVGPQNQAKNYTYEVTVSGRHNSRRLTYKRSTHSDLENSAMNTSRQDCFHLSLDQALNFLRFKNEHSETDKTLDCTINIAEEAELDEETREISDSGGANV